LGFYGAWQSAPVIQSLSPCDVNRLIVVAIVQGALQHIFKLDSGIAEKNLSSFFETSFPKKKAPEADAFFINRLADPQGTRITILMRSL
jgi:hypothetical protein